MSVVERLVAALSDRYTIDRQLGAGGMATVYLAHDIKHDRDVAIKVLHPDLGAALGGERFLSEIRTTARLQHPHILPLLDSGDADGLLYYVMPLVTGESLRARLERERQLPIADAVRIAREVASALDYAHRQNVIHRDIKPENILLHDGSALVADFGIALAVQSAGGQRMTQTGLSLGTPQYMSPEQAMGERTIDARSDIYALGAVVYEMLAGEPPFTGPTPQAIVARVLTATPTPLTQARATVPAPVEHAVLTALSKLPADRQSSARAFAEALNTTVMSGAPIGQLAVSSKSTVANGAGRARLLPWAIAAVTSVAAVVAWVRTASRANADVPTGAITVATLTPAGNERWSVGSNAGFSLSPDGRTLAIITNFETDAGGQLALRAMDSEEVIPLPGADRADFPFWSPSSDSLGFVADGMLKLMSARGRAARVACSPNVTGRSNGATWGSGGEILMSPGAGQATWIVPSGGGACHPLKLVSKDSPPYGRPYFLDDGQHFIITNARQTWIGVLGNDTMSTLLMHPHPVRTVAVPGNALIWVDAQGSAFVQRIDIKTRRLTGTPVLVMERVRSGNSFTAVSGARTGVLVVGASRAEADVGNGGNAEWIVRWSRGSGSADSVRRQSVGTPVWQSRLSRDGTRLAISGSGIAIADVERGTAIFSALTTDSVATVKSTPVWSPRDTMLAFSYLSPNGERHLLRFDPRTERMLPWSVSLPGDRGAAVTDWSPDGRRLLFRVDPNTAVPRRELWVMDVATGAMRALFSSDQDAAAGVISPDGRWVAYESGRARDREIVMRSFPDAGPPIRISNGAGRTPRWRGDSKELFFANGSNIMAVSIGPNGAASSPTVALTLRRPSGQRGFEVTPDGKRFIMTSFGLPPELHLTLLLNWPALLKGGAP